MSNDLVIVRTDSEFGGNSELAVWFGTGSASAALVFILFHKRVCGPLANSLFHHRPDDALKPASKVETAYHKADHAIQQALDLLAAA